MEHLPLQRDRTVQLGCAWHGTDVARLRRKHNRLIRSASNIRVLASYGRSKIYQPTPTPSESLSFKNLEINLPRPDEIDGGKAFQGALAGVIIGTALSLGVSALKATFVAGVVAAFVALVPILGDVDIDSELENEGAQLPGVAVASAVAESKEALQGDKPLGSQTTATVLAASISAGAMVAVFSAKSLGIAIAGAAGFLTLGRDENYDLKKSTRRGRDYLRARGYAGPGVAASLLLLQAGEAAITVGNAVQGKSIDSGSKVGRTFPTEEGVYAITQATPQATPASAAQPEGPKETVAFSADPSRAEGQPIVKEQPAEDLLAEALRLRQGSPPQTADKASGNGSSSVQIGTPQDPASTSPNENLLKQALEFREQSLGSNSSNGGSPPEPEDPKDKESQKAKTLKAEKSGSAEAKKPKEDLLQEALRLRGASASNGSKNSTGNQPKATAPAETAVKMPETSGQDTENLLEEALRLRQEGRGNSPEQNSQPVSVAAASDKETFRGSEFSGSRSDDLILQAQDATASATPGQERLKPQAEGYGSEKNVDMLGNRWRGSSSEGKVEQSSAGNLPRSDGLIMQAQQTQATKPQGLPKLELEPSSSSGSQNGGEVNPAAKGASGLGDPGERGPLKEALRRQQEQTASVQGDESMAEEPEEVEDLLAEALRLRGAGPAKQESQDEKPRAPVEASTLKGPLQAEETAEEPSEGEDLLAEALRLRSASPTQAPAKPRTNKSKPVEVKQTSLEPTAQEEPSEVEDLLAEALRLRSAAPSRAPIKPNAEETKPVEVKQISEESAEAEDLLAEALRLRTTAPSRVPAKPQAIDSKPAEVKQTAEESAEGEDLLAEALRLRGERPPAEPAKPATKAPPPSASAGDSNKDDGGDLLAMALRLREQGRSASPPAQVSSGGVDLQAKRGDLASTTLDLEPTGDTPRASFDPSEADTPLEKVKGANRDVEAGDLASTPVEFTPSGEEPLLQGDSSAQKDAKSDDATPLENVKGGNKDVEVGDLASTPVEFSPAAEEPLLQGDSSAQQGAKSADATPLEKVKGGNEDVEAGDLASTPVEFTPSTDEPLLQGDSPAQRDARSDDATPLEKVKGGNRDVEARDLASTPVEFTTSAEEPLLRGDSSAQADARAIYSTPLGKIKGYEAESDSATPLENLKGGNKGIEAGALASTPVEFTPSGKALLRGDSPAQKEAKEVYSTPLGKVEGFSGSGERSDSATPLEDIKGGNQGIEAGALASTPVEFTPSGKSLLRGDSPAQKQAKAVYSTPLGGLKGRNEDVGVEDVVSSASEATPAAEEPLLKPDSPAQPSKGDGRTPLQRMKGKGTPYEPVLSSNVPFRLGFKESLLARTSETESVSDGQGALRPGGRMLQIVQLAGVGRALQLLSRPSEAAMPDSEEELNLDSGDEGEGLLAMALRLREEGRLASPPPQERGAQTTPNLGSTQDRARLSPKLSNVLQLQTTGSGKVMSLKSFSSTSTGVAATTPFKSGVSAIEQDLPEKQPPAKRSAARPNPPLRVSSPTRPGTLGVNIPSLTKSSAAAGTSPASAYVGRARVPGSPSQVPGKLTPEQQSQAAAIAGGGPALPKGRTAVENWLLVAGSGIVGSLVTLTWRLVQGFTVAEPVNKALMAAILVCMLLIVVLTSLSKLEDKPRPAAA